MAIGVMAIVLIAIAYFFFGKKAPVDTEPIRQAKVRAELELTVVETESTDIIAALKKIPGVTDSEIASYRDGVKKLLEVAPIMHILYQKQIGASPDDRIKAQTDDDRELIDRYGHPWCLSDTSDECSALPSLPKRTSGVIPDGVSCDKAANTGSPFEAISKEKDGRLVTIPYSVMWPSEHRKAVRLLKEAVQIFETIPREGKFALYLKQLADTFESKEPFPYSQSDISWTDFLASDSILFARIGADEVGGDPVGDRCESKARYHFNIGLKNKGAGEIIERLRPVIGDFEQKFADLIGDPQNYIVREVKVQLPTFLDVVHANGDSIGGPNGTPIGQTLPNWCGPDGKGECLHGTMIYVNKTIKAYNERIMRQYIMPVFEEGLGSYFNPIIGLDTTVYHEMFHNLGPKEALRKPQGDTTYGQGLVTKAGVSWKGPIEELKAQTGSLFMASEFYRDAQNKHNANLMDDATFERETRVFREHILYDMAWAMRHILRGSRGGPEFQPKSTYSKLAAVQVGFLSDEGALSFNQGTNRWLIAFDKMPDAITALMKKTGELYAKADVDEVEKFFLYYIKGPGEKELHRARLVELAAKMPSVLFDYQLKGLQ